MSASWASPWGGQGSAALALHSQWRTYPAVDLELLHLGRALRGGRRKRGNGRGRERCREAGSDARRTHPRSKAERARNDHGIGIRIEAKELASARRCTGRRLGLKRNTGALQTHLHSLALHLCNRGARHRATPMGDLLFVVVTWNWGQATMWGSRVEGRPCRAPERRGAPVTQDVRTRPARKCAGGVCSDVVPRRILLTHRFALTKFVP